MTGASGVKETTRTSNSYRAIGLTIHSIDLLRTLMLGMISLLIESTYSQIRLVALSTRTKLATLLKGAIKETTEISSIKKPATTHTLHHSHISTLAQLGINLKAMQEHVGHSDYKNSRDIHTCY
ncbi:TPA: tyrosine-type recombinase/integrase [Staphylococcus aureus]